MENSTRKKGLIWVIIISIVVIIGTIFYYQSVSLDEHLRTHSGSKDINLITYALPGGISVLLGIMSIACIVAIVAMNHEDSKPILRKNGKVLDKTRDRFDDVVTVEFEDGTRQTLYVNPEKVVLTSNDTGCFTIQGKRIISFSTKFFNPAVYNK